MTVFKGQESQVLILPASLPLAPSGHVMMWRKVFLYLTEFSYEKLCK
jgi:hypothetical protein